MSFDLSPKQKRLFLKSFKGYKKAEKFITEERLNGLRRLGIKKGIEHFNEIYRFHEKTPSPQENKLTERLHIKKQCVLRERLNILVSSKVNE